MNWKGKAEEAVGFLLECGVENCETAIILGTGLGNLVTKLSVETEVPYADIPNFPISTVESHSGRLIVGELNGIKCLVFQGRFHFYEGYSMKQVVFPVLLAKLLGAKQLFVSNAAGALNLTYKKGELMLITDHVNLFSENPLTGFNDASLGTRFPDMSKPYCLDLQQKVLQLAIEMGITLHKGVYVSAQGPMLETPAEYRMLSKIGGDAVGMSTVPEVIMANYLGIKVAAISVLTDECDPDNLKPIDIAEIISVATSAEKKLTLLFEALLLQTSTAVKN